MTSWSERKIIRGKTIGQMTTTLVDLRRWFCQSVGIGNMAVEDENSDKNDGN